MMMLGRLLLLLFLIMMVVGAREEKKYPVRRITEGQACFRINAITPSSFKDWLAAQCRRHEHYRPACLHEWS